GAGSDELCVLLTLAIERRAPVDESSSQPAQLARPTPAAGDRRPDELGAEQHGNADEHRGEPRPTQSSANLRHDHLLKSERPLAAPSAASPAGEDARRARASRA